MLDITPIFNIVVVKGWEPGPKGQHSTGKNYTIFNIVDTKRLGLGPKGWQRIGQNQRTVMQIPQTYVNQ